MKKKILMLLMAFGLLFSVSNASLGSATSVNGDHPTCDKPVRPCIPEF